MLPKVPLLFMPVAYAVSEVLNNHQRNDIDQMYDVREDMYHESFCFFSGSEGGNSWETSLVCNNYKY